MFDEYTGIEAQNDKEFLSEGEVYEELLDSEREALEQANSYYENNCEL